jgi:hypothetical protein
MVSANKSSVNKSLQVLNLKSLLLFLPLLATGDRGQRMQLEMLISAPITSFRHFARTTSTHSWEQLRMVK